MAGRFADLGQWLDRTLQGKWRALPVRRLLWAGLFFVLLTVLLATAVAPSQVRVQPGQAAPRDLVAPKRVIDRPATERLRQEAARAVPAEYYEDGTVLAGVRRDVEAAFTAVAEVKEASRRRAAEGGQTPRPGEADREELNRALALDLPPDVADAVLAASTDTLAAMRRDLLALLEGELEQGVKEDQLEVTRRRLAEEVRQLEYGRPLEQFLALLGGRVLRPNLLYDREGTEAARRRAMAQVDPVVIVPGEVIVEAGEQVTEEDMVRLRDAGLLRDDPWSLAGAWGGSALLVLLVMAVSGTYLATFDRRVYEEESRFVLFGFVLLIALALARLLQPISGYVMPVATGTMLLAVLLNPRTALMAAMILGAVVGVLTGDALRYALVAWFGGAASVFAVSRLGQRSDFMRAGLVTALANVAAVIAWAALFGGLPLYSLDVWKQAAWGAVSGILAAILTIGLLPFLESFFGVVTPIRLIELANPNQPLLRRLLVEAPGTYHHSLMVANLAEAAVEEVGGNSLLARVGAYYHDVGKIKRPYFFIENQF
ncbi:MAG TPA: HDIG domain-containing metalloprotein, partial [Thermaerobacter sp.]